MLYLIVTKSVKFCVYLKIVNVNSLLVLPKGFSNLGIKKKNKKEMMFILKYTSLVTFLICVYPKV